MESKKVASGFGARKLHPEEIRQSLPTYEKLKEQIEQVRHNAQQYKQKNDINEQNAFAHPQVINNFAILGSRGTGKSSILKTLYEYLNTENQNEGKKGDNQQKKSVKKKNILLPPIVPENLVSHISLMGCLLGLLKPEVENIAEEHRNKAENKMCLPQKHQLEKEYSKLMAEYVQLQQPYEQISVQEFSTDADYVRRMTSVFEAGNQFAIRFRNFIDKLLNEHYDDALLFVFIDDVDLSTNRCGDVVKTLLSYLSHPSIVTVLAGDLEVFGEALTLDFLRQEQIPDTKFIDESYLVAASNQDEQTKTLMERKKQLAYEYLKKVMPPNNRHHILRWTLSMRGDFRPISMEEPASDGEKIPSLRELLVKSTDTSPLLKHYFSDRNSEIMTQTGQKVSDFILYHIFDSTARGLMSGYHAIAQLAKLDTKNPDAMYADIKFALESIVAANSRLSSLQDVIFDEFLILGKTQDSVQVRFDNFNAWVDVQLPDLRQDIGERMQNKEMVAEMPDLEIELNVFEVFVFLDWATRQLGKEQILYASEYDIAKRRALCLLCVNGKITERGRQMDGVDRKLVYFLSKKEAKYIPNELVKRDTFAYTEFITYFELTFPIAIRYFQVIDILHLLIIMHALEKEDRQEKLEKNVQFIQVLYDFYGKDDLFGLAECLVQHTNILQNISSVLNMEKRELLFSTIADDYFKNDSITYGLYCFSGWEIQGGGKEPKVLTFPDKIMELDEMNHRFGYISLKGKRLNNRNERYLETLKKKLRIFEIIPPAEECLFASICYTIWLNMFKFDQNGCASEPFYHTYVMKMEDILTTGKKYIEPVISNTYMNDSFAEKIDVIKQIDKANLWTFDSQSSLEEGMIAQVKKYIYSNLMSNENRIFSSGKSNIVSTCIILSQDTKQACVDFYDSYDGISGTLAKKCKMLLKPFLSEDTSTITTLEYIAIQQLLQRLILSTTWYGKEEARRLLKALEQCQCNVLDLLAGEDESAYKFWLHCYCRYRVAECSEVVYTLVNEAEEAMKIVEDAMNQRDDVLRTQYFETLSKKTGMREEELKKIPSLFI